MGERLKKKISDIDYHNTQKFFAKRAEKYEKKFKDSVPYSVTMYQDDHPELVMKRNEAETATILPLLRLDANSKVLDIACGIGRWSDAIRTPIREYCGLDFSEELIEIARNAQAGNRCFLTGSANAVESVLNSHHKGKYDRILIVGLLMYLNDQDVCDVLAQVERVAEEHAVICVREPVGIEDRLTLNDIFSEELNDHYSAIYRTRDELMSAFTQYLLCRGFTISREAFMFEDALNNRKETAQYYWIFER